MIYWIIAIVIIAFIVGFVLGFFVYRNMGSKTKEVVEEKIDEISETVK